MTPVMSRHPRLTEFIRIAEIGFLFLPSFGRLSA
jgi:hypothetical protein